MDCWDVEMKSCVSGEKGVGKKRKKESKQENGRQMMIFVMGPALVFTKKGGAVKQRKSKHQAVTPTMLVYNSTVVKKPSRFTVLTKNL